MEKELFYILQEIKVDINCLNIKYLQDKLEVINFECIKQEDDFEYYNKKFFLNNLKLLLLDIISFGQYKSEKHLCRKKQLEIKLDLIEEKYLLLLVAFDVTDLFLKTNKNKEPSLKKNFNQIDKFLSFVEKMTPEEKEKIFSYKMGVNNG